ncbi:hypothetical protein J40TS1_49540 [Paenibacillus montaniterrae]|uniref:Uncharacterized protein n=1 Tax=Paenibacillus montaniterrae TaxID=429341 RepID=A0A920CWH6_9BACL|nr:hypothetical protein J40TS1_49540 [Paenibacillus montaniterrae]
MLNMGLSNKLTNNKNAERGIQVFSFSVFVRTKDGTLIYEKKKTAPEERKLVSLLTPIFNGLERKSGSFGNG